jgi:hypothetical protein
LDGKTSTYADINKINFESLSNYCILKNNFRDEVQICYNSKGRVSTITFDGNNMHFYYYNNAVIVDNRIFVFSNKNGSNKLMSQYLVSNELNCQTIRLRNYSYDNMTNDFTITETLEPGSSRESVIKYIKNGKLPLSIIRSDNSKKYFYEYNLNDVITKFESIDEQQPWKYKNIYAYNDSLLTNIKQYNAFKDDYSLFYEINCQYNYNK